MLNPIEELLRAAGCEVAVLGPGMERDEWQLVVDGEIVARGPGYGAFQKDIERWANESKKRKA